MKKEYQSPLAQLILCAEEDVLTLSYDPNGLDADNNSDFKKGWSVIINGG